MREEVLFLTGKLAESSLHKVLAEMSERRFDYKVAQIGITVAALMTTKLIKRRLTEIGTANKIVLPGRCDVNLNELSEHYSVEVIRGPDELKDLPRFFSHETQASPMQHDIMIFAEITDAPLKTVDEIVDIATTFVNSGADVIDLGCLPDTPFPHLEASIQSLRGRGYRISIDSVNPSELVRADRAGVEFLLSLSESTLWVAEEVAAIPVIIPDSPGDIDSLVRCMVVLDQQKREYIADPILNPIPFGFMESLMRYQQLRKSRPDIALMMGVANLTELIDADTAGVNALLIGIAAELNIQHVLTAQVSRHACNAIKEIGVARSLMCTAVAEGNLPRGYSVNLMAVHEKMPFISDAEEVTALASCITDPNYRVQVTEAGIHVFNRDGIAKGTDPFYFWPQLAMKDDSSHAFYMGVELARAQIAWQLGKRYVQDRELDWGVARRD